MTVHFQDHTANGKESRTLSITDMAVIDSFKKAIETLPSAGDKFIKMDAATLIEVTLTFAESDPTRSTKSPRDLITFFNGKIKAPNTGFFETEPAQVKKLYGQLMSAVLPSYLAPTLKIKNTAIQFPDFAITYLGVKSTRNNKNQGPAESEYFLVKSLKGDVQEIQIGYGDEDTPPTEIKIENKSFFIVTKDRRDKAMFPEAFKILR